MTFDSDMAGALLEAQEVFGSTATWYPLPFAGGESKTLRGVLNEQDELRELQDAGYLPQIDAVFVCDRAQFALLGGEAKIDHTLVIDGTTYRIADLSRDAAALTLRLKTP